MKSKNTKTKNKVATPKNVLNTTIAKSDDGTIQITFVVDYKTIEKEQTKVLESVAKDIEVPGFRKGKAPLNKVAETVNQNTLTEQTLQGILPDLFVKSVQEHKLKPAIYPKFQIVKSEPNESWEILATTCELPEITLSDYKSAIKGSSKSSAVWTPDKGSKEPKVPTQEEKESLAIKTLLETVKLEIPNLLIEEEVNARLSKLLERIEKLGLTLDNYLASVGKTPEAMRAEYESQSKETIKLDLILTEIAEKEVLKPDKSKIDEFLAASKKEGMDPTTEEQQKTLLESSLKKRAALDYCVSLM